MDATVPDQQATAAVAPDPPTPHSLQEALHFAQQAARTVEKAAKNAFHGYDYASAESVFLVARDAMHGTGLSVVPLSSRIERVDGEPIDINKTPYILHTEWILLWGAESMSIPAPPVPVVPSKGRPSDKALLGAWTTARSYALQAILNLSRVEKGMGDLAGRDDSDYTGERPAKRTESAKKTPTAERPAETKKDDAPNPNRLAVANACKEHGVPLERVVVHLKDTYNGRSVKDLTDAEVAKVTAWILQEGSQGKAKGGAA